MTKTILVLMLALALALTFAGGIVVFADNIVYTEGTLHYTVEDGSITITGCFGRDAEVTVPSMIAGTPVNTIAAGAFVGNRYLKTLYLPDTIQKMERESVQGGVKVVYNANTDHPQDTPTEIILRNLIIPTESPDSIDVPGDTSDPTEGAVAAPTAVAVASDTAASAAAAVDATPSSTEYGGTTIIEGDIEDPDDITPTPTVKPTAAGASDATPGSAEGGSTEGPATESPAPAETDGPDSTGVPRESGSPQSGDRSGADPASNSGDKLWVYVLIGIVVVSVCAAVMIFLIARKRSDLSK